MIKDHQQPIPVFLISYNRGQMLAQAIAALRHLQRLGEIIVHDNGSDDSRTLAILNHLEQSGIAVHRHPRIHHPEELNNIDGTIRHFFARRATPGPYVVSDCDIDMTIAAPHALAVFDDLLDRFPHIESVGPMLRIRDIPTGYPLYNRVMNRHIEQFWSRQPSWIETAHGMIAYQDAPIDTSFALHRAGAPFWRLKPSLRVYDPFEARHLDWYRTAIGPDPYAHHSSPDISHWNNAAQWARHADDQLEYEEYFIVKTDDQGRPAVHRQDLT